MLHYEERSLIKEIRWFLWEHQIQKKKKGLFIMPKLSEEMRLVFEKLRVVGFLHVTGLVEKDLEGDWVKEYPIVSPASDWGRWGLNNEMFCAVTAEGHVWIRPLVESDRNSQIVQFLDEVCSKGKGAGVPCSNGHIPHADCILRRLADPLWEGDIAGMFPSDPEVAGLKAAELSAKGMPSVVE